jgi:WD40 repeat protein
MVMALHIRAEGSKLQIIAGYESGHTVIYVRNSDKKSWQKSYVSQPHSQPVLSLAVSPSNDYYLTSSADAIIAKHPLLPNDTDMDLNQKPIKLLQTKHSGQQGLSIRSDGRLFSTAGWDGRIRVYSVKTMKELAVLKWHKDGCFATTFAKINFILAKHAEKIEASNFTLESEPTQEQQPLSAESIAIGSSSHCVVSQRREYKAQTTHWLAAGSKDGKVSLWDIY